MAGSHQRFGDIARQVRDWASLTLRLEPDLGAAIDLHEDTYQRQENKPYLQVAAVFTGQLGREQA